MTTPLNAMHRVLNAIEREISKGSSADLREISDCSLTFHRIIKRNYWAGLRLEIKDQFVERWTKLDRATEELSALSVQNKNTHEEQLSLAI